MLTKQEILLGKHRHGEQEGKGTHSTALSHNLQMGLLSGLSLANPSDLESFLVVHALFSQDGCQQEGFWEVVGHMVSLLNLS